MEAAGLVLAVIPLLISAAENYEITFQPFVTYRRHAKEVQRFSARLDAQRAIFHNECQLLLIAIGQNLPEILRDPNHPSRKDEQLSQRLEQLLGASYTTCVSTLKLINETLDEVTTETAGFKDLLDIKNSKGKSTWSLFRQKIKISFSKTRLNDIISELRVYNEDLVRLSSQIRKLGVNSVQPSSDMSNTVTSHLKITQQASIRLHDVLSSKWACNDQTKHIASISLAVEDKCFNFESKVRFHLAISCIQPRIQPKPLFLTIESAPDVELLQPSKDEQAIDKLQSKLESVGAKSRVRFALTTSTLSHSRSAANSNPLIGPQLDLCAVGRLCQYFRQARNQDTREPCMGFLEKSKTFKHFVYPSSNALGAISPKSNSLKEVLLLAAEQQKRQDEIEKLKLARLLSLAVLRFYSTPWLAETWSSRDVRFFNHRESSEPDETFKFPCLESQLSITNPQIPDSEAGASGLAINEWLFNLGIVLIELGYNTPFEKLTERGGLQIGPSSQVTNFLAARRLGGGVHREMNPTYGRLVEKCLNCNFGVATCLDDVALQGAVVVHVVNQLDLCIKQYQAFNSLAPLPMHI